jgi:hypothetical protein
VRKLTRGDSGSPSAKLLLAIITLAVISLGGYYIASHKSRAPSGSGVYTYRGYAFPNMPSSFAPTKPIAGVLFPYATVYYTTTGPLSMIESEIKNVCEGDHYYYPPGAWGGINSSFDGHAYTAHSNICSTKNDASRWQFNISLKTTPGTYDVSISSDGPPVPS